MVKPVHLLIASDLHYASEAEKARGSNYELASVKSPWARLFIRCFRQFVWLKNPFAHNHLIEPVLSPPFEPDLVVLNGDYSCDSGFIGLSDPPSRQSAEELLGKFRARFGERLRVTLGDHEFGKRSLAGDCGGLRIHSFEIAHCELKIPTFWGESIGGYVLLGVTSSLIALPVFEKECLPEERERWRKLREEHLEEVRAAFRSVRPDQRIVLFCHDPTALPYLHDEEVVAAKLGQIERTVIGHLHTPLVLWKSRLLAGMPVIGFAGNAVRRMSTALHNAAKWKPFKILLCPSVAGVELTKGGGFYSTIINPNSVSPLEFRFHRIKWNT